MFRNFIFDWSGTLADDLALVMDATNTVFRHYGLEEMDKIEFRSRFRLPYPDFYAEVLPGVRLGELEDIFRDGFNVSVEKVSLLPYAREFMEYCRERGIRCFALTSVDKNAFEQQVTELGMKQYFEAIYAGTLNKLEVIHDLMREHALHPDETAFIGDMTHDVDTAASAGITSIAVLTGYQDADQLSRATPDIITPDLSVLKRLLEKRSLSEKTLTTTRETADLIHINGLELDCHVGVPEKERSRPQRLLADITLVSFSALKELGDEVTNTIDYAQVALALVEEATIKPRKLIETLAEDLCRIILDQFPVAEVRIRLYKFILPNTSSVSVEMSFRAV